MYRWVGMGIAALWAAWFLYFAIASALANNSLAADAVPILIVTVVTVGLNIVAVRRPASGAVLLIVAGLFIGIGYLLIIPRNLPSDTVWFVEAVFALPPILAGLMLLAGKSARNAISDQHA